MAHDTLPADDVRLAQPIANLAAALADLRQLSAARAQDQLAIALLDRAGDSGTPLANALFNLAEVEQLAGNCRAALAPLERARGLFARLGGEDSDNVRDTVNLGAACDVQLGHHAKALAASERVLASPATTPTQRAAALLVHGKALVATGRGAAGLREARAARALMAEQNFSSQDLADADAWLATHP
jgi:tetratricopeptide (TPR) repeat protein